jgi:hypothetical protein
MYLYLHSLWWRRKLLSGGLSTLDLVSLCLLHFIHVVGAVAGGGEEENPGGDCTLSFSHLLLHCTAVQSVYTVHTMNAVSL